MIGTHGGKVIFGAATAATKVASDPGQIVKVSGKISASGKKPVTKGGPVEITGEMIELVSADIDASGEAGGGTILIGGDYHGGVPTPLMQHYGLSFEPYAVPRDGHRHLLEHPGAPFFTAGVHRVSLARALLQRRVKPAPS